MQLEGEKVKLMRGVLSQVRERQGCGSEVAFANWYVRACEKLY